MLTDKADKISHHKTKEYFNEVLRSYEHNNYRSAVVMLYSVVICDLIFKLMDLRDIHEDKKAQKILEELNSQKENAPVSSEWETKLIEKCFNEAKLLENDVYTHIDILKKYRNLSAHPVLSSIDILYEPSKETVLSLMTNLLDGLLTRPPYLTKNIFQPFLIEIARIKDEFSTYERLNEYMHSKFLRHFNKELTEYVFKNLWKTVFNKNGTLENENKVINLKALIVLYKNNQDLLSTYISKEADYFSQIIDSDSNIIEALVNFISKFPETYPLLNNHTQQIIRTRVKNNFQLLIKGHFLYSSVKEHFDEIDRESYNSGDFSNQPFLHEEDLARENVDSLYEIANSKGELNSFYELMIKYYIHSGHFDRADIIFNLCIDPFYKDFNKSCFEKIFAGANYNYQCYAHRYAKFNHDKLKEKASALFEEGYDFENKYPNLF